MKFKLLSIIVAGAFLTSCGDPDAWSDERKQILTDQCDTEIYDCECYVETTISEFPKAQEFDKIMSDESANAERVDAYWEKINGCIAE